MGYRSLLVHRCTINRNTATGRDSHNRKNETFTELAANVPCRFVPLGGRENADRGEIVTSDFRVHFLSGQDITEKDQVVFESKTYDVELVSVINGKSKEHHRETLVKLQKL